MKNFAPVFLLLSLILFSCASVARIDPPPDEKAGALPSPPLPEKAPPRPEGFERVIQTVRENSPAVRKYFTQGDDLAITVRGELSGGEWGGDYGIVYDFFALPPPGGDSSPPPEMRLRVEFTLTERESGYSGRDFFIWTIESGEEGILLSFDDNYEDVWESWFDAFDAYGARVNFFVHSLSPFCASALSRGHDVGYHSRNHLNLPKAGREAFFEETLGDIDAFRGAGIPLLSFAYPYGLWEPWMHGELLARFSALRGYGVRYRLYTRDEIKGAFSSSAALDNTLYKGDDEWKETVTLMLRAVKFLGGVVPLTTHTISDTAAWGIKPQRLRFLLESARELKLNFYRYSDFCN